MLYHVSENGEVPLFAPRGPKKSYHSLTDPVVWAINGRHLPNYLLPRDCPRVCFYATPESKPEDARSLLGPSRPPHVVAIESSWFERACNETVWVYELPGETFEVLDEGAGYYVSRSPVKPMSCRKIERPLLELLSCDVELRVVTDLRLLQDAVIKSTLQFSCIRMRNLDA